MLPGLLGIFGSVSSGIPEGDHFWSLLDPNRFGGSVTKQRRSLDNTEQDFTNASVTDGSLATFASGSDTFSSALYDQFGLVDLRQTAQGNQPQAYDSATGLESLNGHPVNTLDTSAGFVFNSPSGFNGIVVIGLDIGVFILNVTWAAGNDYLIPYHPATTFNGVKLIGVWGKSGATTEEQTKIKEYFIEVGSASPSLSGLTSISAFFRNLDINSGDFDEYDYSLITDVSSAWRVNNLASFPAIDLSSATNIAFAWSNNNLTNFPLIDLSSVTIAAFAWSSNDLTSFPAIDLPIANNITQAWTGNSLTSFPLIDLASVVTITFAWRDNNLTSFPSINFPLVGNAAFAWQNNDLVSFPFAIFAGTNCTNFSSTWNNNDLDQASVDGILTTIEASGTSNGTLGIDGGTNAAPSAAGQSAADALRARGWTVNLNGY